MSGSWTERGFRPPDEGTELKADNSVLDVAAWRESVDDKLTQLISSKGTVSTSNSTSTLLNAGSTFTGVWEDVTVYDSIVVAAKTDQNGYFTIQFSPDGTNVDSTLTRYYRTNQIEAPHRFTITRQYCRITFTNSSASNQTYLRLQSILGPKTALNAPTDSVLAQDYDATIVRPTDFDYEVALGRRQGYTDWNKFGYNADIDTGTEVIWSNGGSFTRLTTARTLSLVSTSTADDLGGTGAQYVIIYGIDANRQSQTVVLEMNGTTPVVTTETWLGVNRIAVYLCGTAQSNVGIIIATATTDLTVQGHIPVGDGTTQQCIFFTQADHQALVNHMTFISFKDAGGGANPVVRIKGWVYSFVSQAKYLVFRGAIDTDLDNHLDIDFGKQPFQVGEKSVLWFEATTDKDNTEVSGRFSLKEVRDVDA